MPHEADPAAATATAPIASADGPEPQRVALAIQWLHPTLQVTPLDSQSVLIGRDAQQCQVVISDQEVSRQHCELVERDGVWIARDLGSRNGVRIDGHGRRESRIVEGSVLRVGSSVGVVTQGAHRMVPAEVLDFEGSEPYIGSGKLKDVLLHARRVGARSECVLIRGESGTGKEHIAHLLHRQSGRPGTFVALNCATLRGDLANATLVGHTKGAFSGAASARPGALRSADKGTLFLDEIAEFSLDAQPLLLRFLEDGEIAPLGTSATTTANVRVVCATHRDLQAACEAGEFRLDLYYRLTSHTIQLPPLRERRQDVLFMFLHYSQRAPQDLSPGAVERLLLHPWPGNVRQLRNVAAELNATIPVGEPVRTRHLAPLLTYNQPTRATPSLAKELNRGDWEALYQQHSGIAAAISRATGFTESTVKRYLKHYRLRESG